MATKIKKTVAAQTGKRKRSSRAKKSAAASAVKRTSVKLADVKARKHKTNRYDWMGHPKNSEATRTTNRRHAVEQLVSDGITLGALVEKHGQLARRNCAKHALRGGLVIAGLTIKAGEKPVVDDGTVAARIAKLPNSTKLKYKAGYTPRNSATIGK